MKYKLIVDKQSRTNPSADKREYEIDIEELRVKGDVYDSLVITVEETYIMRRLSLSEYQVLSVLDEPVKEPLGDLNVQLFEGDNYIYLMDMTGNKFYAEYIIKNEFNELYVTNAQMNSAINQSARGIELAVNQKLTGYSTTEDTETAKQEAIDEANLDTDDKLKNYSTTVEMNAFIDIKADEITNSVSKTYTTKTETANAKKDAIDSANASTDEKLEEYSTTEEMNSAITQKADEISAEVSKKVGEDELSTKIQQDYESVRIAWNKISEFIQFINAQLQIKDNSKKLLMALDKLGMHFYKSTGTELGDVGIQDTDVISFAVMNGQGSMAWGIKYTHDGTTDFYPVFSFNGKMVADGGSEAGGYGFDGHFDFEAPVRLFERMLFLADEKGPSIYGDITGNLTLDALNLFLLGAVRADEMYNDNYYSADGYSKSIFSTDIHFINAYWNSQGLYVADEQGRYFSLYASTSDKRLKENIKDSKVKALDKIKQIKHREFDWKANSEHQEIGYIAQEMQEIDPTFVRVAKIKTKDGEEREDWQINTLSVLASVTKAMQEQDEEIENLKEKDKQKDILIQSLLERIERLEANNG